jgi:hypothetical protein
MGVQNVCASVAGERDISVDSIQHIERQTKMDIGNCKMYVSVAYKDEESNLWNIYDFNVEMNPGNRFELTELGTSTSTVLNLNDLLIHSKSEDYDNVPKTT